MLIELLGALAAAVGLWGVAGLRVVRQYERGVVFRLGRNARALLNPGGTGNGPGLVILVPLVPRASSGWYLVGPLIIVGIGLGLQVFVPAYIMTGGGPLNSTMFAALYIYKNAFEYSQVGLAAAASGILFVINAALAIITFWSSKYWVNYHLE